MIGKNAVMDTLLELVEVGGISGGENENISGEKILEVLGNMDYFKNNPENIRKIPVKNDKFNRFVVSALYENPKKTNKTIVITGHFDVVGIDEFGHLKDIAFNVTEFTKRVGELPLTDDAREDLESGDYIFGRGCSDMKYGLALCLEVLREVSSKGSIDGNLLFIGVPGEESNSEGMLEASRFLAALSENGYEFLALLNSECTLPKYKGDTSKKIYLGSCGKVMPLFYFVGKEAHVCEPFSGLNPNLLASEVNALMEVNASMCDIVDGDITPPPVCLKQMDMKERYSVQSPCAAASYYNMIYLTSSADEIVEKLKNIALKGFENALDVVKKNLNIYNESLNGEKIEMNITPRVITYNELYSETLSLCGEAFEKDLEEKIYKWIENGETHQNIAINIIKTTFEWYPKKNPVIIIGFSPSYYPVRSLDNDDLSKNLLKAVDDAIGFSRDTFNREIHKENYFMGISDLSYTGLNKNQDIKSICKNILGISYNYNLPIESLERLNIPSIVFGGFGKDFHKYTERLNISYSINEVPSIYEYIINRIFEINKISENRKDNINKIKKVASKIEEIKNSRVGIY